MEPESIKIMAIAIVMGLGTIIPAFAIGWITSKAVEAMGRNPEAAGKIQTTMFIGIAVTDALAIFALVIGFIIKFT